MTRQEQSSAAIREPETIGDEAESSPMRTFRRAILNGNYAKPGSRIHSRPEIISLTTFRKTGAGVPTPVWFGEQDGKLYVMTRSDMGKAKRIRNNPQVRVAPCTIRGKVTGESLPHSQASPAGRISRARKTINRKYWMAWISTPISGGRILGNTFS